MVTSLVQNVVRIASNLLHDSNKKGWADLGNSGDGIGSRTGTGMGLRSNRRNEHRGEIGRAVTALMIGLEENAFLLADAVTSEKVIIKPTENIRKLYKPRNPLKIKGAPKYYMVRCFFNALHKYTNKLFQFCQYE